MDQMLLFPEIDYPKTKKELEKVLKGAKRYRKIYKHDPRIQRIDYALNCLKPIDRHIIEQFYFEDEKDYIIYSRLNVESTKYYEIKKEAICLMASALGIEIFKETLNSVY